MPLYPNEEDVGLALSPLSMLGLEHAARVGNRYGEDSPTTAFYCARSSETLTPKPETPETLNTKPGEGPSLESIFSFGVEASLQMPERLPT